MDIKAVTPKEQEAPAQGLGLKLFISGGRPESTRAVARLQGMLQDYDLHADSVRIVDIEQDPQLAKEAQVIGVPALVKEHPLPRRSVIGDLSDATAVLRALGLPTAKKRYAAGTSQRPHEPLIPGAPGSAELDTVRVLLVDYDPVVREGLRTILAMDHGIDLILDAADSDQALVQLEQALEQGRPVNVVLTETRTGAFDGIQTTRLIKEQFPKVDVMVLTENPNDSYVIDAIRAGAAGYIFLKDMSPELLLQGIRRVVMGDMQIQTALLRAALENLVQKGQETPTERTAQAAHLTERELEVLRLLGHGDSNNAISATLGITLDTTKKHVRNVIHKMQARSRTHAAIIAAQAGILGRTVSIVAQPKSEPRSVTSGSISDGQ
jgi:DNA-binding NarL/FixJ family response regulator